MNAGELVEKINLLRKERNAVILAHNYQAGEVQDLSDFTGDSLELSRKAAVAEADVIVFCGVHFMAETAAVLSPRKTVLLPDPQAGCPMADMISAEDLRRWKTRYPGRPVVCYVNTTAEVKAESDICCTSSNAVNVVNSLRADEILFVPDKNLAAWVARATKTRIIAWDGYCYVHQNIVASDVLESRRLHPGAKVWVHPECRPEVIDLADRVLSTGQMVVETRRTVDREIILGTESGIIHRLNKENPAVAFHPIKESAFCFNMKKINLPKILQSLETMTPRVEVAPGVAERARGAIERMIRIF